MPINLKKAFAAGTLCTLLLLASTPAAARVTVTVEVASGGVVVCGLGFFLYFAGSWESPLATYEPRGVLLELSAGRAHVGLPIPALRLGNDPAAGQVSADGFQLDLLRWRF